MDVDGSGPVSLIYPGTYTGVELAEEVENAQETHSVMIEKYINR